MLLRFHIDGATASLYRVWRSEQRLQKDRHLYGGGSGQTITIVVPGEPKQRAGRALLLAAVDHLEGRGERGDLADCLAVTAIHSMSACQLRPAPTSSTAALAELGKEFRL